MPLYLRPWEVIKSNVKAIISMIMNVFCMDSCIKHNLKPENAVIYQDVKYDNTNCPLFLSLIQRV